MVAIATWILVQVSLVVFLCFVEGRGRCNLSADGLLANFGPQRCHFVSDHLGDLLLLFVVVEDGRAVLGSLIITLPRSDSTLSGLSIYLAVHLSRIVETEKQTNEVCELDFGRIIFDLHDFSVAGSS